MCSVVQVCTFQSQMFRGVTYFGTHCIRSLRAVERKHGNVSALINRAKKIRRQVRIAYQIIYLHYDRGNV